MKREEIMRGFHFRGRRSKAASVLTGVAFWAVSVLPQTCLAQSAAPVKRFEFQLAGGLLAVGDKTVRVVKGDTVELRWTSDRPVELHLHGYDLQVRANPDAPQVMRFEARATGRFPVETHGSSGRHATLIYVEVHPR